MDLKKVRKNPESGKKTSNFYVTSQSAGRSHPMVLTRSEDCLDNDLALNAQGHGPNATIASIGAKPGVCELF